jgi:hypothetical protein
MAMNEVTQMTADLKQKEGVLTNESFQKIVMEVKNKRNLPDDFEIKKNTVTRRLQRKKSLSSHTNAWVVWIHHLLKLNLALSKLSYA